MGAAVVGEADGDTLGVFEGLSVGCGSGKECNEILIISKQVDDRTYAQLFA